jgi:hypothetical protein
MKARPLSERIWYHLPFPSTNKGKKNKKKKEQENK